MILVIFDKTVKNDNFMFLEVRDGVGTGPGQGASLKCLERGGHFKRPLTGSGQNMVRTCHHTFQ